MSLSGDLGGDDDKDILISFQASDTQEKFVN